MAPLPAKPVFTPMQEQARSLLHRLNTRWSSRLEFTGSMLHEMYLNIRPTSGQGDASTVRPDKGEWLMEHEKIRRCWQQQVLRLKYSAYFESEDLCDKGRKLSTSSWVGHKAILKKNRETKIDSDLYLLVTSTLFASKRERYWCISRGNLTWVHTHEGV